MKISQQRRWKALAKKHWIVQTINFECLLLLAHVGYFIYFLKNGQKTARKLPEFKKLKTLHFMTVRIQNEDCSIVSLENASNEALGSTNNIF